MLLSLPNTQVSVVLPEGVNPAEVEGAVLLATKEMAKLRPVMWRPSPGGMRSSGR